jgi:hypothetical protein
LVDRLHDVIRSHGDAVVGRGAAAERPLWSVEPDADSFEAHGKGRWRFRALRGLLDGPEAGCGGGPSSARVSLRRVSTTRAALGRALAANERSEA